MNKIMFTYIELEKDGSLFYLEWLDRSEKGCGFVTNPANFDDEPIPDEIIAELARQIGETRKKQAAPHPRSSAPDGGYGVRYVDFLTGKLVEVPPFDPTSGVG